MYYDTQQTSTGWVWYREVGVVDVLPGNSDLNTEKRNDLGAPFWASRVRIYPVAWSSAGIGLRAQWWGYLEPPSTALAQHPVFVFPAFKSCPSNLFLFQGSSTNPAVRGSWDVPLAEDRSGWATSVRLSSSKIRVPLPATPQWPLIPADGSAPADPKTTQFTVGTTTEVSYSVQDEYGNQDTCAFDVTAVAGTYAPTLMGCPSNIIMHSNTSQYGNSVQFTIPVGAQSSPTSNAFFRVGTSTVTVYSASEFCQFNVTILDTRARHGGTGTVVVQRYSGGLRRDALILNGGNVMQNAFLSAGASGFSTAASLTELPADDLAHKWTSVQLAHGAFLSVGGQHVLTTTALMGDASTVVTLRDDATYALTESDAFHARLFMFPQATLALMGQGHHLQGTLVLHGSLMDSSTMVLSVGGSTGLSDRNGNANVPTVVQLPDSFQKNETYRCSDVLDVCAAAMSVTNSDVVVASPEDFGLIATGQVTFTSSELAVTGLAKIVAPHSLSFTQGSVATLNAGVREATHTIAWGPSLVHAQVGSITISAGDLVYWVWQNEGVLLNVVSADGTWTSGTPQLFGSFYRRFNVVGTYTYSTIGGATATITVTQQIWSTPHNSTALPVGASDIDCGNMVVSDSVLSAGNARITASAQATVSLVGTATLTLATTSTKYTAISARTLSTTVGSRAILATAARLAVPTFAIDGGTVTLDSVGHGRGAWTGTSVLDGAAEMHVAHGAMVQLGLVETPDVLTNVTLSQSATMTLDAAPPQLATNGLYVYGATLLVRGAVNLSTNVLSVAANTTTPGVITLDADQTNVISTVEATNGITVQGSGSRLDCGVIVTPTPIQSITVGVGSNMTLDAPTALLSVTGSVIVAGVLRVWQNTTMTVQGNVMVSGILMLDELGHTRARQWSGSSTVMVEGQIAVTAGSAHWGSVLVLGNLNGISVAAGAQMWLDSTNEMTTPIATSAATVHGELYFYTQTALQVTGAIFVSGTMILDKNGHDNSNTWSAAEGSTVRAAQITVSQPSSVLHAGLVRTPAAFNSVAVYGNLTLQAGLTTFTSALLTVYQQGTMEFRNQVDLNVNTVEVAGTLSLDANGTSQHNAWSVTSGSILTSAVITVNSTGVLNAGLTQTLPSVDVTNIHVRGGGVMSLELLNHLQSDTILVDGTLFFLTQAEVTVRNLTVHGLMVVDKYGHDNGRIWTGDGSIFTVGAVTVSSVSASLALGLTSTTPLASAITVAVGDDSNMTLETRSMTTDAVTVEGVLYFWEPVALISNTINVTGHLMLDYNGYQTGSNMNYQYTWTDADDGTLDRSTVIASSWISVTQSAATLQLGHCQTPTTIPAINVGPGARMDWEAASPCVVTALTVWGKLDVFRRIDMQASTVQVLNGGVLQFDAAGEVRNRQWTSTTGSYINILTIVVTGSGSRLNLGLTKTTGTINSISVDAGASLTFDPETRGLSLEVVSMTVSGVVTGYRPTAFDPMTSLVVAPGGILTLDANSYSATVFPRRTWSSSTSLSYSTIGATAGSTSITVGKSVYARSSFCGKCTLNPCLCCILLQET